MELSKEDWKKVQEQAENLLKADLISTEINKATIKIAKEKCSNSTSGNKKS